MMKIPILAFGPGLVGWRNAATAKLLIVTTRVVIGNSWAPDVPNHVKFKSKMTTQLHKFSVLGCIFSPPPKYFETLIIGPWKPVQYFFPMGGIVFSYDDSIIRFSVGFERREEKP